MNQQPDQFFRDKLEGFHKPVPASAWQRVEKNLDKKPSKFIWLKIAAGLIFVLSASVLYWKSERAPHSEVATNSEVQLPRTLQMQTPAAEKTDRHSPNQENEKKKPVEIKSAVIKRDGKTETHKELDQLVIPQEQHDEPLALKHEDEMITETDSIQETPIVANESPANGITLIYSAEEVNEKYLNKKSLAEATQEKKKPSTMKKLLDKAYDLKYNQDALGELRQKKNEILALNFKTEKTQTQTDDL